MFCLFLYIAFLWSYRSYNIYLLPAKVQISERNAKRNPVFIFISKRKYHRLKAKSTGKEPNNKYGHPHGVRI